jgi:SSS family solute:Na+ symporter
MSLSLFIVMAFCLQAFYWFVGRQAAAKVAGKEDYFLAGKSVKLFPLMMTFLATQVGGGVILGAADEAYHYGWPVLLYPLGSALGLILLGCGIGKKLAGFEVSTVAEIFQVVYGSKILRKIASGFSVVSLFMILVAQIIASQKFLASLGVTNTWLFILFWAVVILYTAEGGLKAVISTDIVQAALFSVIFLACFGFVMYFEPSLPQMKPPTLTDFSLVSSKLCGWLLMPILFMVIEQDMGQRCFAGESARIVSRASFLAGVCTMVICVVPVFFGTLAKASSVDIPVGTSVLMAMIAKTTTPFLTALVGCAVLAAIISTATSLINAISSNIASDFGLESLLKKDSLLVVKTITCVISSASIFCAFYFDNIVDMLILSYELSVSCLFIPVIMALWKRKGQITSAALAIALGAVSFILLRMYPVGFPREILSLLFSASGYLMGEFVKNYRLQRS